MKRTIELALAGFAFFGMATAFVAFAAVECRWTGGASGNWADAGNWDTHYVPSASDRAVFAGSAEVTLESPANVSAIVVDRDAVVSFPSVLPTAASIEGFGVIKTVSLPTGAAATSLKGSTWRGTLWLHALSLADFRPDDYGNGHSAVAFSDCTGSFAQGLGTVETAIGMFVGSEGVPSLRLNGTHPGETVRFRTLIGGGCFESAASAAGAAYEFVFDDISAYAGSILLANGDLELAAGGSFTIALSREWRLASGAITVPAGTTLVDNGLIGGRVVGEGTVVYTGSFGAEKIEAAAAFTESDWRGRVVVTNAVIDSPVLARGGNANSSFTIGNVKGILDGQAFAFPVELGGNGLEITAAAGGGIVRFSRLVGDGPFVLDAGDSGAGVEQFQLLDVLGYTGRLKVGDGDKSFSIGSVDYSGGGSIDFADGVIVPAGLGWISDYASFGGTLMVTNGVPGDVLVEVGRGASYYDAVKIRMLGAEYSDRYCYGLDHNIFNGKVTVVASATPPIVGETKLQIDYGPDLKTADLTLSVKDFWGGIDYNGGIYAQVIVRNGAGEAVKIFNVDISGDCTTDLGSIDVSGDANSDYTYEVVVIARRSQFDSEEVVSGTAANNPVAHVMPGTWVHETAETFPLPAAEKTGSWSSVSGGTVAVDGDDIAVNAGEGTEQLVTFTAKDGASEDIVKMEVKFDVQEGDVKNESSSDMSGMFLLEGPDPYGKFQLSGYNPKDDRLERLYGAEISEGDGYHLLHTVFNYTTGKLSYQLDGHLMTNSTGTALFEMSEAMKEPANRVRRVSFTGQAKLGCLEGDLYSSDIAAVVSADGTETNRFASVNEAVASATNGTESITLLWNASWTPKEEDVGKTYSFSDNGFKLIVDETATNKFESEGYRLVDNADGSYTIGVINYTLTLAENDLEGGDSASIEQLYSVTNRMIALKLADECFTRSGFDFARWNTERDGSGDASWTDGAVIDMTPYGLTNMTVYAQWALKVRAVRIEASDPSVYIELVSTNDVTHTGVRYFKPGETEETRYQAMVPVEDGCSNLVIRFSTDLGRRLSSDFLKKSGIVTGDEVVTKDYLPTNLVADANGEYGEVSPVQTWAAAHFVPQSLASVSPYAMASSSLDAATLISEKSDVVISGFRLTDTGCAFRVTVDGEPLGDPSALDGMVKISADLKTWTDAKITAVGADGSVEVVTDTPGAFVKIVIPKD